MTFAELADTLRHLPDLLVNSRHARRQSLNDVQRATGISKGYLSEIERGIKEPGLATVIKILDWLESGRVNGDRLSLLTIRTYHPEDYRLTDVVSGVTWRHDGEKWNREEATT